MNTKPLEAGDLVQTEDGLRAVVAFVTERTCMAYLHDGTNPGSEPIGFHWVSDLKKVSSPQDAPGIARTDRDGSRQAKTAHTQEHFHATESQAHGS